MAGVRDLCFVNAWFFPGDVIQYRTDYNENATYWYRVVYDDLFFLLLVVLMLAIVSGA